MGSEAMGAFDFDELLKSAPALRAMTDEQRSVARVAIAAVAFVRTRRTERQRDELVNDPEGRELVEACLAMAPGFSPACKETREDCE